MRNGNGFYVAIVLGLLISLLAGIAAIAEEDIMATAELETIESADAEGTPEIKPQIKEPSHCIFAPWFNAKTSIAFSSGVDKDFPSFVIFLFPILVVCVII